MGEKKSSVGEKKLHVSLGVEQGRYCSLVNSRETSDVLIDVTKSDTGNMHLFKVYYLADAMLPKDGLDLRGPMGFFHIPRRMRKDIPCGDYQAASFPFVLLARLVES